MTRYLTHDVLGDGITVDDEDDGEDFSLDEATVVRIDNPPFERAFDIDRFYKFTSTIARPIEQTYRLDGETYTFTKPREELKKAAWTFDNAPYPLGHPSTGQVTSIDEVHGFHRNPRYDDERDGLVEDLYVPTDDGEALDFITNNRAVSVGFYNTLDWDTDDEDVDAYQRDIFGDHVAGVKRGRCPIDAGCGVTVDCEDGDGSLISSTVSEMADGVAPPTSESEGSTSAIESSLDWSEGDWVSFTADGERHHGRLEMVDEERALVREWTSDGELADESTTVATSSLNEWVGPHADSCDGDVCHCGCHEGDTSVTEPLTDATTVMDTITYGGVSTGDLDESAIPNDDYEDHYVFDAETKSESSFPLVDADGDLRRGNVASAYRFRDDAPDEGLLMDVLRSVNDAFDDPPINFDSDSTMTDDTPEDDPSDDDQNGISLDDLLPSMTVDALAEHNDEVADLVDTLDERETTIDEKEERIEEINEQKEALSETIEALDTGEKTPKVDLVDAITDRTDYWDEDDLLDCDRETLVERKELAADLGASPTAPEGETAEEPTNDDPDDGDDDDGLTVGMEHRSWG